MENVILIFFCPGGVKTKLNGHLNSKSAEFDQPDLGTGPGRLQQGVQEIVQMLRDQEALRVVVPIDVGLRPLGKVMVWPWPWPWLFLEVEAR